MSSPKPSESEIHERVKETLSEIASKGPPEPEDYGSLSGQARLTPAAPQPDKEIDYMVGNQIIRARSYEAAVAKAQPDKAAQTQEQAYVTSLEQSYEQVIQQRDGLLAACKMLCVSLDPKHPDFRKEHEQWAISHAQATIARAEGRSE